MNAAIGVLSVLESEAKAINGFRRDLGKWLARMEETNWDVTGSTGPDELTLADLNHTVIRLLEARATVERLLSAAEGADAFIGVMFGSVNGRLPETVDTPLGIPVKLGAIARDLSAALAAFNGEQ